MDVSVSVIVPVYNKEAYLRECVKSILCQDYGKLDVLLVDDGSTDSSPAICDEFSSLDPRVKVIHKANGGASDARNAGIENARGDYLLFVDADDYLSPDFFKRLKDAKIKPDTDVVFFNLSKAFPDGSSAPMNSGLDILSVNDGGSLISKIAALPKYAGSACGMLIRRGFVADNNLLFIKGVTCEDIDWTLKLYLAAKSYAYLPIECYYYRQYIGNGGGGESLTSNITQKTIMDLTSIIKEWSVRNLSAEDRSAVNACLAYEYCVLLADAFGGLKLDDVLLSEIKSLKHLLSYGRTMKIKIVKYLSNIVGVKLTGKLLSNLLKWRRAGA